MLCNDHFVAERLAGKLGVAYQVLWSLVLPNQESNLRLTFL